MKLGFVGLGIMGKPMSKNLLKAGHSLVVYDLNAAAVAEVVAAGAEAAATVVLGEGGLLEGAKAGDIIVDMSSIAPLAAQEVAAKAAEKGVEMLDAPVSGGEPKAIDGTLSIMVGGKQEIFDRVKDILAQMGKSVVRCGDIGAGNTTKLANQIIVALNIAAVSEALVLGAKAAPKRR